MNEEALQKPLAEDDCVVMKVPIVNLCTLLGAASETADSFTTATVRAEFAGNRKKKKEISQSRCQNSKLKALNFKLNDEKFAYLVF